MNGSNSTSSHDFEAHCLSIGLRYGLFQFFFCIFHIVRKMPFVMFLWCIFIDTLHCLLNCIKPIYFRIELARHDSFAAFDLHFLIFVRFCIRYFIFYCMFNLWKHVFYLIFICMSILELHVYVLFISICLVFALPARYKPSNLPYCINKTLEQPTYKML